MVMVNIGLLYAGQGADS